MNGCSDPKNVVTQSQHPFSWGGVSDRSPKINALEIPNLQGVMWSDLGVELIDLVVKTKSGSFRVLSSCTYVYLTTQIYKFRGDSTDVSANEYINQCVATVCQT